VENTMNVILLNGVARSGKDTVIDMLAENPDVQVISASIIDPVKYLLSLTGWDKRDKSPIARKTLSDVYEATMNYNLFPLEASMKFLLSELKQLDPFKDILVVIVARSPDAINIYKTRFESYGAPVTTVVVRNTTAEKTIPDNVGDQSVFTMDYDMEIYNDGSLDDLRTKVHNLLRKIGVRNSHAKVQAHTD